MPNGDTPENPENEELQPLVADDFLFYKSKYIEVLNGMRERTNATNTEVRQNTQNLTNQGTRINEIRNELIGDMNSQTTNINNLVKAFNKLQTRVQKLEKENKIFKTTLQLYTWLFENLNPITFPIEKATGNLTYGSQFKILFDTIREKWAYIPTGFTSSSVSKYDGYDDDEV